MSVAQRVPEERHVEAQRFEQVAHLEWGAQVQRAVAPRLQHSAARETRLGVSVLHPSTSVLLNRGRLLIHFLSLHTGLTCKWAN